jgi:hypothetical protein
MTTTTKKSHLCVNRFKFTKDSALNMIDALIVSGAESSYVTMTVLITAKYRERLKNAQRNPYSPNRYPYSPNRYPSHKIEKKLNPA